MGVGCHSLVLKISDIHKGPLGDPTPSPADGRGHQNTLISGLCPPLSPGTDV